VILTYLTYKQKLEELIKAFVEKNHKNEEAYDDLKTKTFTLYNPVIYYIKTEKEFRNACRSLYDFILHVRKMNACPDDIFPMKKKKNYIMNESD
jgi:hypothetical protein